MQPNDNALALHEFLLTPLREGRQGESNIGVKLDFISTHAPAGGATETPQPCPNRTPFLLTPLREGRRRHSARQKCPFRPFLLTPLREGRRYKCFHVVRFGISTHAPAGGATCSHLTLVLASIFLLTPLREGRHLKSSIEISGILISTHAPAGGATCFAAQKLSDGVFLLTPLREGRQSGPHCRQPAEKNFYSRPCGRGDWMRDPDGR